MIKHSYILWIAIAFVHCASPNKPAENKLANSYKYGTSSVHPDYVFYNTSIDSTTVYFRIPNQELLYVKRQGMTDFISKTTFNYRLYENSISPIFVDSASFMVENEVKEVTPFYIYGSFKIKTEKGKKYYIRINSFDINRSSGTERLLYFDRSKQITNSDFLFTDASGELPSFKSYFTENEEIYIKYNGLEEVQNFDIYYFNRDTKTPLPPFSIYNPKPFDYKYEETVNIANKENFFAFKQKHKAGFYLITNDLGQKQGLGVNVVNNGYPNFKTESEMLLPLKYITSKKEYGRLTQNENPKEALEAFWLKVSKSPSRGKAVVQTYYNRVKNANELFNCYKEGWATDRGMIYIIFGPPEKVKQANNLESWIYGEANSYLSPTFNFIKVENPFSDNDFILQRSSSYKDAWYREVEMWRQGRVSELDF